MKGLSGKRKLSFLGTGLNIAFMEIFKYPIYIERGKFYCQKVSKKFGIKSFNSLLSLWCFGNSQVNQSFRGPVNLSV